MQQLWFECVRLKQFSSELFRRMATPPSGRPTWMSLSSMLHTAYDDHKSDILSLLSNLECN